MERVRISIQKKSPLKDEKVVWHSNGDTRYSDVLVYPLASNGVEGAVVRIDDITERVRIEEMMIQSEKMVSVGGLAAGMAHEINNPLGAIMQGAQNIQRRLSPNNEKYTAIAQEYGIDLNKLNRFLEDRNILRFLQGIRSSGERAARIISNMLKFSRRSESKLTYAQLYEVLDRSLEMANSDYDLKKKYDFRNIKIIKQYNMELKSVPCTETELEQVFLNLFRNATQAMTENSVDKTPTITLRTFIDGDMARIEIEDNGPGMDEETRKRIFEPFFTTKPVGTGTGLGLSVSYMIITNNHQGTMAVESELGRGTKFIIRLPLVTKGGR